MRSLSASKPITASRSLNVWLVALTSLFYGRSAHGAIPWAGENAVLRSGGCNMLPASQLSQRFEGRQQPYLLPPSLNIGKITGGIQWNIVPEFCKVETDRRLLPGETREAAMDGNPIDPKAIFRTGRTARIPSALRRGMSLPISTRRLTHELVRVARECLSNIRGKDSQLTGYALTSDGRWFAGDDTPIIVYGPGDPTLAHASNEYITIEEAGRVILSLTLLAYRYLG